MSIFRQKPYCGCNFLVDLGTGNVEGSEAGLLEVIFPDAHLQVIEYRNGNDKTNEPSKTQCTVRYGNLVLRRGAIGSVTWYEWWNAIRNGDTTTRDINVSLLTEDRTSAVLTWRFLRARPVRYHFSPLNALNSEPLMETLEIAFERFEME